VKKRFHREKAALEPERGVSGIAKGKSGGETAGAFREGSLKYASTPEGVGGRVPLRQKKRAHLWGGHSISRL